MVADSKLPLQQFAQRRIGTGQKIIEATKKTVLPSSSGERRPNIRGTNFTNQGLLRSAAGYTDIVDLNPTPVGLSH